jgi:outer membrane protein assembly factor BamB
VKTGAYTASSPALTPGGIYFGAHTEEVFGIDRLAKRIKWRYQHPDRKFPFNSSAAASGGRIVIGGRDKMVHCLDEKTGKAVWTFMTRARVESSPAIAGGHVYVGSHDGRLYVLSLEKGGKLWEFEAGGAISSSPAIADGKLYFATQDGKIYCLGAAR